MTLKRKVAATTLALSLAMSAFTGLSTSNEGIGKVISSNVASAAAFPNSGFVTKMNALYNALVATNNYNKITAMQSSISSIPDSDWKAIFAPITAKIIAGSDLNQADMDDLTGVIRSLLTIQYDNTLSGLEALRTSPQTAVLQRIADEVGAGNLTLEDFADMFVTFQDEVFGQLDDQTQANLGELLNDFLAGNHKFGTILGEFDITGADLKTTTMNFADEVGLIAFFNVASALKAAHEYNPNTSPGGGDGGSGGGTPPAGGGGGGGGVPSTPVEVPADVQDLLNELSEALEGATDEEKQDIIDTFIADAIEAATELAAYDAQDAVQVDGDEAVLELDVDAVLKNIAGIQALVDQAQSLGSDAAIATSLVIQTGEIEQGSIVYQIPVQIFNAAAAADLSSIIIQSGDFSVEIPLAGTFKGSIQLEVNKSDVDASELSDLQAASLVYDFNLFVNNREVTSFTHPLIIALPLGDIAGLDKELLSLAKIEGNTLTFFGGRVTGDVLVAARDSFSQYVVLENKVTFGDIASVVSWAGRGIEVVAAKGAIVGKADGVFAPDDNVTRGEFAKMLIHALNLLDQSAEESFADVNNADWFQPYVASAVKLGIINGRSDDQFEPNATITRAEMATMIARALKATAGAVDVSDQDAALAIFSDAASIHATLKAGVSLAVEYNIVEGAYGKFSPNDNATRAQAAVMIHRTLNVNN